MKNKQKKNKNAKMLVEKRTRALKACSGGSDKLENNYINKLRDTLGWVRKFDRYSL